MKSMVTISTYNEKENIGRLLQEIRTPDQGPEVVVADDDSPDGTWQIVQELSRTDPAIHLLHRKTDKGRGSAGRDAFQYAYDHGADLILEMDGDLSHDPRFIPSLIKAAEFFDVVIGSRYIAEGKDLRKSLLRKIISRISTGYSRAILGLPVIDCNSGYRCFRRSVFAAIPPAALVSTGPSIVHELLYKAHCKGFSIGEVPIEFFERDKDQSKLTFGRLLQGLFMVMKIRLGMV
jgi:dolichol-phosphate mannosyltransferase